jgi:putative glutamine amidotransferase
MTDTRPFIGIVSYGRVKNPKWYSLPITYVEALRRSGGRTVIIPPGESEVASYVELCDGFVLAGGGDIAGEYFGQEDHPAISDVDPERDLTEIVLAKSLVEHRKALLAICRGIQVLNVALGGDIIQHLLDVTGGKVAHQARDGDVVTHRIEVKTGSQLAELCESASFEIASKHHQVVGRLGDGVRAVAWSDDGLVEAIELDGHPEVLGVQWHPEVTAAYDPRQQALFDWLVRKATRP